MPTYDYQCDHCGHEMEMFQSMSAAPIKKCPSCGKLKLRRLIGIGAGVIFKGSGFYETDYRSESYKNAAKAEQGGPASGGDTSKSEKTAAEPATTSAAAGNSGETGSSAGGKNGQEGKSASSNAAPEAKGSSGSGESGSAKSKSSVSGGSKKQPAATGG